MNKYLLDTNVIIGLWKNHPSDIDKLIHGKKIKILFDNINKLSDNDLKLLYACFLDNKLILVTEISIYLMLQVEY